MLRDSLIALTQHLASLSQAYELATLTGTQVLLLVVSQTGLVYTFTTPKLAPVVKETTGKELIRRCLESDVEAGIGPGSSSGGGIPLPEPGTVGMETTPPDAMVSSMKRQKRSNTNTDASTRVPGKRRATALGLPPSSKAMQRGDSGGSNSGSSLHDAGAEGVGAPQYGLPPPVPLSFNFDAPPGASAYEDMGHASVAPQWYDGSAAMLSHHQHAHAHQQMQHAAQQHHQAQAAAAAQQQHQQHAQPWSTGIAGATIGLTHPKQHANAQQAWSRG